MKAMASPACASLGLLVLLCFSICSANRRLLESAGLVLLTPHDPLNGRGFVNNSEPKPPDSYFSEPKPPDSYFSEPKPPDSYFSEPKPPDTHFVKNGKPLPTKSHLENMNQELGLPGLDSPVPPPPPPPGSELANTDQDLGLARRMLSGSDTDLRLGFTRAEATRQWIGKYQSITKQINDPA